MTRPGFRSTRKREKPLLELFAKREDNHPVMDIVDEIEVMCPHCGGRFTIEVETTESRLEMIEDCSVCCHPLTFHISCKPGSVAEVSVEPA